MPPDNSPLASFRQRALATCINAFVVVAIIIGAEIVAASPDIPSAGARAVVASKSLSGMLVLFWLGCSHVRSSPGLALMKLRVVPARAPEQRLPLVTALLRPLPFGLFVITVTFPVHLLPRALAPGQFLLVLLTTLFLAANATPLWSGPARCSLIDKWLRTRVIRKQTNA